MLTIFPEEISLAKSYGVVFRISNKNHRRFGRLSVAREDFGPSVTNNFEVAKQIAFLFGGFVVPGDVAFRMDLRHQRRLHWEYGR